ncbi:MAG TPA: hypothetical protein VKR24_12910 [Candidatus Limnocylindrales bacterium]|nr:hypothetical protein [Candidatus Limnocylindrales bacterium]
MSDRGATALAVRLNGKEIPKLGHDLVPLAEAILGASGLFIADVTKHEPMIVLDREDDDHVVEPMIRCTCGWRQVQDSYFDHLVSRPIAHLTDGQLG